MEERREEDSSSNVTGKPEVSEKHVKFSSKMVDSKQMRPAQKMTRAGARVSAGRGRSSPILELGTLLGLFALVLYMAIRSGRNDEAQPEAEQSEGYVAHTFKMKEALQKSLSVATDLFTQRMEGSGRTDPCSVFHSHSSIPGAAKGLFAGRDFDPGELVLTAPKQLIRIDREDGTFVFLSPYALLLKHHPSLVNAKGMLVSSDANFDNESFEIRALMPIPAGSEIFVSFIEHPHGSLGQFGCLFSLIPTPTDYLLADEIRKDASSAARWTETSNTRSGGSEGRPHAVYPAIKRAVGRLSPIIARLLPNDAMKADVYDQLGTSALGSLDKPSMATLRIWGSCLLDDLAVTDEGVRITRSVKKANLVTLVPVQTFRNPLSCLYQEDCERDVTQCVGLSTSEVIVCPLVHPEIASLKSAHDPNVELVWGEEGMMQKSVLDAVGFSAGILSWKLVAMRDIEPNEQLRLRQSPESIIPSTWRKV